jgi:hypothetical protein
MDLQNLFLEVNLGSQITPKGVMGAMNPFGVHLSSRLIAGGVKEETSSTLRAIDSPVYPDEERDLFVGLYLLR